MIPASTVLLTATGYTVNGQIPAKVYIDAGLTTEMAGAHATALGAATSVYIKFGVMVNEINVPKCPQDVNLDFLMGDQPKPQYDATGLLTGYSTPTGTYDANGCLYGLVADDNLSEWDVDCNVIKVTTDAALAGTLQDRSKGILWAIECFGIDGAVCLVFCLLCAACTAGWANNSLSSSGSGGVSSGFVASAISSALNPLALPDRALDPAQPASGLLLYSKGGSLWGEDSTGRTVSYQSFGPLTAIVSAGGSIQSAINQVEAGSGWSRTPTSYRNTLKFSGHANTQPGTIVDFSTCAAISSWPHSTYVLVTSSGGYTNGTTSAGGAIEVIDASSSGSVNSATMTNSVAAFANDANAANITSLINGTTTTDPATGQHYLSGSGILTLPDVTVSTLPTTTNIPSSGGANIINHLRPRRGESCVQCWLKYRLEHTQAT